MHRILADYEDRLIRQGASSGAIHRIHWLNRLVEAEGFDLENLEHWEVEAWLSALPYSLASQKALLGSLRSACRYARLCRRIDRDPTEGVKLAKQPDVEPRILSSAELRKIRTACLNDRDWLLFHIFVYTGVRRFEGFDLRWGSLNGGKTLSVIGKGGKRRLVPIHPKLAEVLAEFEPGDTDSALLQNATSNNILSPTQTYTISGRLQEASGVKFGYHDFRRTVASSLFNNGVTESIIDKILGWASPSMGMKRYISVADETLQNAILCLYADDPL